MTRPLSKLFALVLCLTGCGEDPAGYSAARDQGVPDGTHADAGPEDAGEPAEDAGTPDAGPTPLCGGVQCEADEECMHDTSSAPRCFPCWPGYDNSCTDCGSEGQPCCHGGFRLPGRAGCRGNLTCYERRDEIGNLLAPRCF